MKLATAVADGIQKKGFSQQKLTTNLTLAGITWPHGPLCLRSERETYLIGGARSINDLKHPLFGTCSTPDPERDSVIIIGGNDDSPQYRVSSRYNKDGWQEDFGLLNYRRYIHGCTSYVADKKRVTNYCFF